MLKIMDRNCLISIVGGVKCFCIKIYKGSLIPTPIESIAGERRCRSFCCDEDFGDLARYMFEDRLYKCFNNQTDFNQTQALPPDEEGKRKIETARVYGDFLSQANILNSYLSIVKLK